MAVAVAAGHMAVALVDGGAGDVVVAGGGATVAHLEATAREKESVPLARLKQGTAGRNFTSGDKEPSGTYTRMMLKNVNLPPPPPKRKQHFFFADANVAQTTPGISTQFLPTKSIFYRSLHRQENQHVLDATRLNTGTPVQLTPLSQSPSITQTNPSSQPLKIRHQHFACQHTR